MAIIGITFSIVYNGKCSNCQNIFHCRIGASFWPPNEYIHNYSIQYNCTVAVERQSKWLPVSPIAYMFVQPTGSIASFLRLRLFHRVFLRVRAHHLGAGSRLAGDTSSRDARDAVKTHRKRISTASRASLLGVRAALREGTA